MIAEADERVYAEMEQHLAALVAEPERPDAREALAEIVDLPPAAGAANDRCDGIVLRRPLAGCWWRRWLAATTGRGR